MGIEDLPHEKINSFPVNGAANARLPELVTAMHANMQTTASIG